MAASSRFESSKPIALSETPSGLGSDAPLGLALFPQKKKGSFYDYEGGFFISWYYDDAERERYANPEEYALFANIFKAFKASPTPSRNCTWDEMNPKHEKGSPKFQVPPLFQFFHVNEKGEIRFRAREDYKDLFGERAYRAFFPPKETKAARSYAPPKAPVHAASRAYQECVVAQLNLRTGTNLKYSGAWIRRFCAGATVKEINALQTIMNCFIKAYETPGHPPLESISRRYFRIDQKGMLRLKPLHELAPYLTPKPTSSSFASSSQAAATPPRAPETALSSDWQFTQTFPWGRIIPSSSPLPLTYATQTFKIEIKTPVCFDVADAWRTCTVFFERQPPAAPGQTLYRELDRWKGAVSICLGTKPEKKYIYYTLEIFIPDSIRDPGEIQQLLKERAENIHDQHREAGYHVYSSVDAMMEGGQTTKIFIPPTKDISEKPRLELVTTTRNIPCYGSFILQDRNDEFDVWEGVLRHPNYLHDKCLYPVQVHVPTGLTSLELKDYLRNHMNLAAYELTRFAEAGTAIRGILVFRPPYEELVAPEIKDPTPCIDRELEVQVGYQGLETLTFSRSDSGSLWEVTLDLKHMTTYPLSIEIDPKAPKEVVFDILSQEVYKALDRIAEQNPKEIVPLSEYSSSVAG